VTEKPIAWWKLLLIEAGLLLLMVASYFAGVSLGAESLGEYWKRVVEGGIQWKVST
jgi:hypothetical protein